MINPMLGAHIGTGVVGFAGITRSSEENAMTFLEMYGTGLVVIMVLMVVLWLVSLVLKNSSIVDIFWGTGFVIATWVYFCSPRTVFCRASC